MGHHSVEMCVFTPRGERTPHLLAHEVIYGASWEPSAAQVFVWRNGAMRQVLEATSSEPLRLDDLAHDGRYEVCNRYEIGREMCHAEQPRWSDIYAYKNGRYVVANEDFPAEYEELKEELQEISQKYPNDSAILQHLGEVSVIYRDFAQARRAYQKAERACLREIRQAESNEERTDSAAALKDIRQQLHRLLVKNGSRNRNRSRCGSGSARESTSSRMI